MLHFLALLCLSAAFVGDLSVDAETIGAIPVKIESYPYQLSLEVNGKHRCGATIISEELAVTAAHCVAGTSIRDMTLRAGSTYLGSGGTTYYLSRKIVHKKYDSQTKEYDIALLQVATRFTFGTGVSAVALPAQGEDVETGSLAVATGWAKSPSSGSQDRHLQAIIVSVVGQFECQRAHDEIDISPSMMCAKNRKGGKDACQVDPGSPLVYENKLIGIASSWGHNCARPQTPGGFTRVATLRNWLVQSANSGNLAQFSVGLQVVLIFFHLLFN